MKGDEAINFWLNAVAYSHSGSSNTESSYRLIMSRYCEFTHQTPTQIVNDYERAEQGQISERTVLRQHNQKITLFASNLAKNHATVGTIRASVTSVMSFYKYHNLMVGKIPLPKKVVTYHNRDITRSEVVQIAALTPLRIHAFMYVMAQSGLRPFTLTKLCVKDIEQILEENTPIPCMITVSNQIEKGKLGEGHPSFICEDGVKALKLYLATRQNLTPDSLLFDGVWSSNVSKIFSKCAKKLAKTGAINFKIRERKPSELRLYNLRKFFRKFANQMGFEHVNYLMNHSTNGSDGHYMPKDTEFYRELYREKAMPFLQLDQPTPTEHVKVLDAIKEQHKKEIASMNNEFNSQMAVMRKQMAEIIKKMNVSSAINTALEKQE